MRNGIILLSLLLCTVGAVFVFYGIWQLNRPAAYICLGISVIWYSIRLLRSEGG